MRFADRQNPVTAAVRRPSPLPADVSDAGRPLQPDVRASFERRFDHDFSRVRVHADAAADRSARSVAASAYTVGSDIVFGSGMYQPGSHAGQRLLAHELAHVVQQQRPSGAAKTSARESEAAGAATRVARGERANVSLAAPLSIQRQPAPGALPDVDLTESASPLMASAIGSVTLDGFVTGQADLSGANQGKLARTGETILKLLKRYPASKIHVLGYTDAVGQETDNQSLGQSRADSVQAALHDLGIPDVAIQAESRGANDLAVKTTKGEARNRRVEVRFDTSSLLRGAMPGGLTLGQPGTAPPGPPGGGVPDLRGICVKNPTICYGTPSRVAPNVQPGPDNTPYQRMDLVGVGVPGERGDLSQTWAQLYRKYRDWGLSANLAAKAANKELSATSGAEQSRNNPSQADRLDKDMKQGYPDSTSVGPANYELGRF